MNTSKAVRRERWTPVEAKKHFEAQACSGLNAAAYERDNGGIGEGRLWWWRRRKLAQDKPQRGASAFVPVQVKSAKEKPDPTDTRCIELRLGQNRVLKVLPGFDPTALQQLIAALEQTPC